MRARCPDGVLLAAWVDGEAEGDVSTHLDECARCLRVVQGHRQVKRRTASLSAGPDPAPGHDLLACLLTVPTAEHARARATRAAAGTGGWSRPAGVAIGALAGAGLVAATWMAPLGGVAGAGGSGAPTRTPVTVPAAGPATSPANSPATSPAAAVNVSLVRWARAQD